MICKGLTYLYVCNAHIHTLNYYHTYKLFKTRCYHSKLPINIIVCKCDVMHRVALCDGKLA